MTVQEWLSTTQHAFKNSSILTPQLDSEVLLCSMLGVDRSWIHAHDEYQIDRERLAVLSSFVDRRISHEPLAYILGKKDFYGREFFVDSSVLVPRSESEDIVELFLSLPSSTTTRLADLGCGSGVLGITVALERPNTQVALVDIDPKALHVAQKNAEQYELHLQYVQSDLLGSLPDCYDTLLCNLPYVPLNYPINEDATHEPEIALFSGHDGLDHYRKLFEQIKSKGLKPIVITESLTQQHDQLSLIARSYNYRLVASRGLAQLFEMSD